MHWVSLLERRSAGWRSDSLDVLRALLALYVVAVHLAEWKSGVPGTLTTFERWSTKAFQSHGETNPAVLAFIALSGYCIHRNGARSGGSWVVRSFAIRRWFRIMPVFVLATAAGALVFELAKQHSNRVEAITSTHAIGVGCLTAKLSGAAAFAPGLFECSFQGNGPLNTVMVEIWLYIAYGIVAWMLLRGVREGLMLSLVAALFGCGFVLVELHPGQLGWWGNGSFLGFLGYWWVGAAVVGIAVAAAGRLLVLSALTWCVLTVVLTRLHEPHAVLAAAETRKIAFAVACASSIVLIDHARVDLPRALTALGRSGYSLYAFHAVVLVAVVAYDLPWWLGGVLPIATASVMYLTLERPGIRVGRVLATRSAAGRQPAELSQPAAG